MNIPLEDNFTDILGKAQRGLGLTDDELARFSGLSISELGALKSGAVDEAALVKIAAALGLGAKSLSSIANSRYQPAPVPELEGLAFFQSEFYDMTVSSYVVWDPASREAAFFDTGSDGQPLLDFTKFQRLHVNQIFITHIHTDHIFDLDRLLEKTHATARVCAREPLDGAAAFEAGEHFHIGRLRVETRWTCGHALGGITYFVQGLDKPIAIVGDAIFAGSMGGGRVSYADALRTNREQILTLPDQTILCPGHGPLTTVGEQKISNPFFAD